MKKLKMVLSLMMIFGLSACSSNTKEAQSSVEENEGVIAEYMDEGYMVKSYGSDNTYDFHIIMYSEQKNDYEKITLTLTDEEVEEWEKFDVFDENYEETENEWLRGLSGEASVESMESMIPSQEELDQFVGMTGEELEAMDCMLCGWDYDENGILVYQYSYYDYDYEDPLLINVNFHFEGIDENTEWDDLSNEDLYTMKVTQADFISFC